MLVRQSLKDIVCHTPLCEISALCAQSPKITSFWKITVYFLSVFKNKLCIYHLISAVLFFLFTSLFLSAAVSSG